MLTNRATASSDSGASLPTDLAEAPIRATSHPIEPSLSFALVDVEMEIEKDRTLDAEDLYSLAPSYSQ